MVINNFQFKDIPKEEIWRYLGRTQQKVSPEIESLTEDIARETMSLAKPRVVLMEGPLERDGDKLSIRGVPLEGEGIRELLEGCSSAALLAVTLGIGLDRKIKAYETSDLTRAVIMDACASAAVETVCDWVSENYEEYLKKEGLYSTERFSPGYSDLPLSIQRNILKSLDTSRKIGLNVSKNHLLLPRKSVTAVIGVRESPREPRGVRCERCLLKDKCKFGICSFKNANAKSR